MSAAIFEARVEPGKGWSIFLAVLMHLGVFYVLTVNLNWKNRPAEAVQAEIWVEPLPQRVEPKPVPKPEPAPPPVAKPEPVIEKPDIALKKEPARKEPPKKEAPKKEVAKVDPKPRVDEAQKRMREELAREQATMALERERQNIRDQLARDAVTASRRGLADYEAKIRNKVRGNIILPNELPGNPEAVFLVVQLPTGEVLSTKLAKSSGHPGYDEAVERAILKSSPLPKPDRPELFSRELTLRFRPRD